MRPWGLLLGSFVLAIGGCGQSEGDAADLESGRLAVRQGGGGDGDDAPPPGAKVHYQRGAGPVHGGGSALMTLHGGLIMPTNHTYALFWGPDWSSASFAGDKMAGMERFFRGMNGSRYAAMGSEYYGIDNVHVSATSTFGGSLFDTSVAPTRSPSVSSIVAEVCTVTGGNPDPSGVYFAFTSTGLRHSSFCAWHSFGTCSTGAPVQVAYMPNIDGISGCDPGDVSSSSVFSGESHSQGLAALANVTGHELLESMTDPRNGGWWDAQGQENGDKCAWTFTAPVTFTYPDPQNPTTTLTERWKIQQEWSNAIYPNGNPNLSGQKGCIQGN